MKTLVTAANGKVGQHLVHALTTRGLPVRAGVHSLAKADGRFADSVEGLQAVQRRINKNPLGSAAGYGTPGLPLDREFTTRRLGFAATQEPVTAAQLSRGKAESALLFEITLMMHDLSRMASDLLLFYTQEFAYISLAPEVTTGSSIMPQKRNPDVLELLRAASATKLWLASSARTASTFSTRKQAEHIHAKTRSPIERNGSR